MSLIIIFAVFLEIPFYFPLTLWYTDSHTPEGGLAMPSVKIYHLFDIMDLYDFADSAVVALTCLPTEYDKDGNLLSIEFGTKQYGERELRAMRGEAGEPFDLSGGIWLGKPASYYILTYTPVEIRDQYLAQHKERICNVMWNLAKKDHAAFSDNITDDYLLSVFSVRWYEKLSLLSEQESWQSEHGLPAQIPSEGDRWYVWIGDRLETGSIEYVASEYCRNGLCLPYRDTRRPTEDFLHEHEFSGILKTVLDDPEHFSIDGLEEYYSQQEIEFLQAFVQKLREDVAENRPKKV